MSRPAQLPNKEEASKATWRQQVVAACFLCAARAIWALPCLRVFPNQTIWGWRKQTNKQAKTCGHSKQTRIRLKNTNKQTVAHGWLQCLQVFPNKQDKVEEHKQINKQKLMDCCRTYILTFSTFLGSLLFGPSKCLWTAYHGNRSHWSQDVGSSSHFLEFALIPTSKTKHIMACLCVCCMNVEVVI